MANARVLVVDDEPSVRAVLERLLKREGFSVYLAANATEGLQVIGEKTPDLVILDLNLPDLSGEAVCQQIRQSATARPMPVLILTGNLAQGLPARCLDGGADDYLSKPFDTKELVARVRALLRRPRLYASQDSLIDRKMISLHPGERRVSIKGRPVKDLSPKEFDLLYQLLLHSPKVLDKNTLALKVWGISTEQLNSRTIDVHIRRIRKKLGESSARYLKTVPAIGYQWVDKA